FLRLGFSIAAHLDADVLLIDEVLAVGDEGFQRKCLRRISEQIASGATLVLVSHDLSAIERVCERVVVIERGRVVFDGPTTEGLHHYRALVGAEHGGGESVRPSRGERAFEVTDLELRDAAGRVATVFNSGDSLEVHVGLGVCEPDAIVALEVRAADGTLLYRSEAPADGAPARALVISDLALLGGDYDISVGDRSLRFAVASESTGAQGLIDLRGSWHAA